MLLPDASCLEAVMGGPMIGEDFLAAFARPDGAIVDKLYAEDAALYTPLSGRLEGRAAIRRYFGELRRGFPGLR